MVFNWGFISSHLEMDMRNNLSQQELPNPIDENLLSMDSHSPESLPFIFDNPNTCYIQEPPKLQQALRPTSKRTNPLQEAMKTLDRIRKAHFPSRESEDDTMTKAILAVISSPSSSLSSSSYQSPQHRSQSQRVSAFENYISILAPSTQMKHMVQRQHMLNRAIALFRNLTLMRIQEPQLQVSRPRSGQLHHMISERRRREKLNESFHTLRSLLPSRSKKDKASVLTSTTEYLSSLKAQLLELTHRNQYLEAKLLSQTEAFEDQATGGSSNEGVLNVWVATIDESSSGARIVDLQVNLRGECSLLDLAIHVVEFLKQVGNVMLMSFEAKTQIVETSSIHSLILRLKIEGGEWDGSSLQEAVKRVVADLGQ